MIDLAGRQFGTLIVVGVPEGKNGMTWLCRCECGSEVRRRASDLLRRERAGSKQSCGCLRRAHSDADGKRCSKCKTVKPHSEFNLSNGSPDGRHRHCKECQRRWRAENKDTLRALNAKWIAENPEKYSGMVLRIRERNRARTAARESARRAATYAATPTWAAADEIASIYEQARSMTIETGVEHHVDHIVPLKSKKVCGLHVPANLRVITKSENSRKSNRYWPDMPS
jgi:hypothetical protein